MYNAKTVCESLRRLTTERNIKKTDLAKALGVTYPTIVKWLDGNLLRPFSDDVVHKIADFFQVPIEEITGEQVISFVVNTVTCFDDNLKLIEMPEPCLTINKEIFDSFKLSLDKCVCVLANSNYKNIAVGDRLLVTEIDNERIENDRLYFLVMEDALVLRKVKYNPIVDKVSIINSDDGVEIAVPKIEFFNMMRKVYKILFIERIM